MRIANATVRSQELDNLIEAQRAEKAFDQAASRLAEDLPIVSIVPPRVEPDT